MNLLNPNARVEFRRVAVVGIGLIGGSVAMALKKYSIAKEIVGISRKQATLSYALKNGIIDEGTHELKKGVENADLVILALPVKSIVNVLTLLGGCLKRGCIVTDVGSVKSPIVETAQEFLSPSVFFVGSHPLAGSEKSGVTFSSAELFEKSLCIITPNDQTHKGARERVKSLWTALGAEVKTLTPQEHDKIVAHISHIPHLLAYGLMEAIPSDCLPYGARGLKDTTRIASSDPKMWNDICLENSKYIIQSIDEFVKVLSQYRKYMQTGDEKKLMESFELSKKKRDGINESK